MKFAGTSTLLSRAAFAFLALLVASAGGMPRAYAQDATVKLEAVDVQTLPGQQLQLTLRLSGPAPEPLSFTIDNPARISLDLPKTALALPSRRIDVRAGGLDTILAAEAGGRTRLVMNLDRLLRHIGEHGIGAAKRDRRHF
jgi:type IV pilus assembly protein PilQ